MSKLACRWGGFIHLDTNIMVRSWLEYAKFTVFSSSPTFVQDSLSIKVDEDIFSINVCEEAPYSKGTILLEDPFGENFSYPWCEYKVPVSIVEESIQGVEVKSSEKTKAQMDGVMVEKDDCIENNKSAPCLGSALRNSCSPQASTEGGALNALHDLNDKGNKFSDSLPGSWQMGSASSGQGIIE
ncbi:hypothetical protein Ancab_031802 [Ancistrocladus abbreviatus]